MWGNKLCRKVINIALGDTRKTILSPIKIGIKYFVERNTVQNTVGPSEQSSKTDITRRPKIQRERPQAQPHIPTILIPTFSWNTIKLTEQHPPPHHSPSSSSQTYSPDSHYSSSHVNSRYSHSHSIPIHYSLFPS